jgi:hypothetical protein
MRKNLAAILMPSLSPIKFKLHHYRNFLIAAIRSGVLQDETRPATITVHSGPWIVMPFSPPTQVVRGPGTGLGEINRDFL